MVKPAQSAVSGDAVATASIAGITPEVQATVNVDETGHILVPALS